MERIEIENMASKTEYIQQINQQTKKFWGGKSNQ